MLNLFSGKPIRLLLCFALLCSLIVACAPQASEQMLSEAPEDLPLPVFLRAELIDWNTLEKQLSKASETKAVNATADGRTKMKELLDSFDAEKLELLLVGIAHMPEDFLLPLTKEDTEEILGIIQNMEFAVPAQIDLLNPRTGGGYTVYLKQGEQSFALTEGAFFTIWDSATNTTQLFEWEKSDALFKYIYSILSISYNPSVEIKMMQSNQLQQANSQSRFATYEDLLRYRQLMRTLRASDITKFYHGTRSNVGEKISLEPYVVEEFLNCLWGTKSLAVFEQPENPATGGSEFLYIEWKGRPLLMSWDGYWLVAQLSGETEALIFDGRFVARLWDNAFSQLIAYEEELLPKSVFPTEVKSWWVRTFSTEDAQIYTSRLYLHNDTQKLSYNLLSEFDTIAEMLANATERADIGKPWRQELSLQFVLDSDDKYTLKFFERGVELTYSHWKLAEKTTVRLNLEPQKYALLQQRIEAALSEGKDTTALWLSMANSGRVQAVTIIDPMGKQVDYSADRNLDFLHIAGVRAMRRIPVTGAAAFVEKTALPVNAYTILIDFNNNDIRYTVTVGEQKLHVVSSDVPVAAEYTLADAAETRKYLQLNVDGSINPTVPYYDFSFTPSFQS